MTPQENQQCWNIINCGKKRQCGMGSEKNKACWEIIKEDDACSFHICIDCLVYLARQDQPLISEEELCSILEKRRLLGRRKAYCRLSHSLIESWYPLVGRDVEIA